MNGVMTLQEKVTNRNEPPQISSGQYRPFQQIQRKTVNIDSRNSIMTGPPGIHLSRPVEIATSTTYIRPNDHSPIIREQSPSRPYQVRFNYQGQGQQPVRMNPLNAITSENLTGEINRTISQQKREPVLESKQVQQRREAAVLQREEEDETIIDNLGE